MVMDITHYDPCLNKVDRLLMNPQKFLKGMKDPSTEFDNFSNSSLIGHRSGPMASTTSFTICSLLKCILNNIRVILSLQFFVHFTRFVIALLFFTDADGMFSFERLCENFLVQLFRLEEIKTQRQKWRRVRPTNKICLPRVVMPPLSLKGYPPGLS